MGLLSQSVVILDQNCVVCCVHVLWVSYKFGTRFLAIFVYSALFPSESYMICVNVFHILINEMSVRSEKNNIFSHRHLKKNAHFWQCHVYINDVAKGDRF